MENETLATEMLHELKANGRRWFIAFLVVLALWFATIGAFLWYISLPIEETTVEQEVEGDANALIGIGNYNGNPTESYSEETGAET